MSCVLTFDMVIEKDPQAFKPYGIDWDLWCADENDTIVNSTWSVNKTGLNLSSPTFDSTSTTVWLGGGTVGEGYRVTNHIITAGGLEDDRSLQIVIKNK
jgi:hypothetical protein